MPLTWGVADVPSRMQDGVPWRPMRSGWRVMLRAFVSSGKTRLTQGVLRLVAEARCSVLLNSEETKATPSEEGERQYGGGAKGIKERPRTQRRGSGENKEKSGVWSGRGRGAGA